MNKLAPVLIISLILSIVAVWYISHKSPPNPHNDNILYVGTNTEYFPFSFIKNQKITGFDIDLIEEVAKRLNKTIEFQDMPFDSLVPSLQLGTIQVIAAGITPTPERAERVLFTKPYLGGDPLIILSKSKRPFKTIDELKGKNVAVTEGYTADYYMSNSKGVELIKFGTLLEACMTLESGRVDAVVATRSTIKPFCEKCGPEKFSIAIILGTADQYALAISKKYPELLEPIQKALDSIIADGTIEKLKTKWGL